MDQFEKVEKLRQRANVTYEEAKEALTACEWDLLDAMVYLEKQGKVKGPSQSTFSTSYEEQEQFESVKDKVNGQKESSEEFIQKLGRLFKKGFQKSKDNYFCVRRKGEDIFKVPVWVFILVLLCTWHVTLLIMIIALFFECEYSFCGKDDLKSANKVMEKASKFANKVKDEYDKL